MRRVFSLFAVLAATLGLSALPAAAVELAEVALTPQTIRLATQQSGAMVCGPFGTSTASLSGPLGSGAGSFSATATVESSEIAVALSGAGAGGPGHVDVQVQTTVTFEVPSLGDSTSPIYVLIGGPAEGGAAWTIESISVEPVKIDPAYCGTEVSYPGLSTLLGARVGTPAHWLASYRWVQAPQPPERATEPQVYPAGDHVVLSLGIWASSVLSGPSGSFDSTFSVQIRSLSPAIGNGDLNGDQSVNIVDSTILRQRLAGFPED